MKERKEKKIGTMVRAAGSSPGKAKVTICKSHSYKTAITPAATATIAEPKRVNVASDLRGAALVERAPAATT